MISRGAGALKAREDDSDKSENVVGRRKGKKINFIKSKKKQQTLPSFVTKNSFFESTSYSSDLHAFLVSSSSHECDENFKQLGTLNFS